MPEIDTKLMRAALAVLEAGTFSKAAIALRIGQSGITKQIAALEKELGVDVFFREGKRNPYPGWRGLLGGSEDLS